MKQGRPHPPFPGIQPATLAYWLLKVRILGQWIGFIGLLVFGWQFMCVQYLYSGKDSGNELVVRGGAVMEISLKR